MIIGLYDADFMKYVHVPFNLELMKLSSYYKAHNSIVSMANSFCPEKYGKFIYRKDYYDGTFEKNFVDYIDKIDFGGLSFSNNHYVQLPPEVEKTIPDTSIYDNFKFFFGTNKSYIKLFDSMTRAQNLRLSLDGKNIWEDYRSQLETEKRTNFYFHDYNLNDIEGSAEEIKNLQRKYRFRYPYYRIGNKFPIQVNCLSDLIKWRDIGILNSLFTLRYDGIMEDEELIEAVRVKIGRPILLNFEYDITYNLANEEEFIRLLPKIYKQVVFLRMHGLTFSLYYRSNFFVDKRWIRVIQLMNMFCRTSSNLFGDTGIIKIHLDSMYNYVSKFKKDTFYKPISIDEARKLFLFVKDHSYETFKDFYECHVVKLEGGSFVNDTE